MRTSRRRALIRALDLDIGPALDRALDRAAAVDAIDRAAADVLTGDLSLALNRALALADALADARDLDIASAVGLASNLVRARDRDFNLARDRDFNLARDRVGDLAGNLVLDLDRARAGRGQRGAAGRVVPLAGRLLAAAARLLPAGDRARYAEEFRSELAELVGAGAGRRRQLAHAARVVLSARRLRADLRVPRRRGAAP